MKEALNKVKNYYLTQNEVTQAWVELGRKKVSLQSEKTILLAILAGLYIGLGSHGYLTVIQTLSSIDAGLAKLMGAAVFPVGLIVIVLAGGELFTGNCLISLAVAKGNAKFSELIRNWVVVYFFNFVGALLLVALMFYGGMYKGEAIAAKAVAVAEHKVSLTFVEALIKGILCNILVVLAVWIQVAAKDIIGKIFAIWFPVMLFVLSGFEHSVANMFFIPLGMTLGADISISQFLMNNMLPVTLGNIIGGGIIIPLSYDRIYLEASQKQ